MTTSDDRRLTTADLVGQEPAEPNGRARDTEDLRLALQRYRSFFERLLAV